MSGQTRHSITLAEAGLRIGKSERTVRRLIEQGRIEAHKADGKWVITDLKGEVSADAAQIPADTDKLPADAVEMSAIAHQLRSELEDLRQQNQELRGRLEEVGARAALADKLESEVAYLREENKEIRRQLEDGRLRQDTIVLRLTDALQTAKGRPFWSRLRLRRHTDESG